MMITNRSFQQEMVKPLEFFFFYPQNKKFFYFCVWLLTTLVHFLLFFCFGKNPNPRWNYTAINFNSSSEK